jgi:hypothetical protein
MRRLAGGLFSLQLVSKNKMFFRVPIPWKGTDYLLVFQSIFELDITI